MQNIHPNAKNVKLLLKSFFNAILDIIYPRYCLVCNADPTDDFQGHACPDCQATMLNIEEPYCECCGGYIISDDRQIQLSECPNCLRDEPILDFARACWRYEHEKAVAKLIIELKHGGIKVLAGELVELANPVFKEKFQDQDFDLITEIPLHRPRYARRGFNQAELIARKLAKYNELVHVPKILARIKDTTRQSGDLQSREENVKGAFIVKKADIVVGKSILLIDDVYTTGSTLRECAQVLKLAGACRVMAFTLARPPTPGSFY